MDCEAITADKAKTEPHINGLNCDMGKALVYA